MENALDFSARLEVYLKLGYKVSASSCNSKCYKAILIIDEDNNIDKDIYDQLIKKDTPANVKVDENGYTVCPSCGNTIHEHEYYCNRCGQALEWLEYYKENK